MRLHRHPTSACYAVLLALVLGVGCGGRELTAEEKKVVGAYEAKVGSQTQKFVFLENGDFEHYIDGIEIHKSLGITHRGGSHSWKIEDGLIDAMKYHSDQTDQYFFAITFNGDITLVKRQNDDEAEPRDLPVREQMTYKRIRNRPKK